MPWIEISDSKLFKIIKEENEETRDDEFMNKLMEVYNRIHGTNYNIPLSERSD